MSLWKTPQPKPQPVPRSTLMFADDLTVEEIQSRKAVHAVNRQRRDMREGETVDGVTTVDHGQVDLNDLYGIKTRDRAPQHGDVNYSKPVPIADIYAPSRYENTDPRKHPIYGEETPLQALARKEREAEDQSRLAKLRDGVARANKRAETLS